MLRCEFMIGWVILVFQLFCSNYSAAQAPEVHDLVPAETVVLLQSDSMGRSLAKVAELVNGNGLAARGDHHYWRTYAHCPQVLLARFEKDFCFGNDFWSSSLIADEVLKNSTIASSDKLKHLFPGWAFVAVVPEDGLPVPIFGINSHGGFDWFAEFQRLQQRSAEGDSFQRFGIDVFHAASAGLFFFRHDTIVYGAYSRMQIERLAASVSNQADHKTLISDRLYVRANRSMDRLHSKQWDLELFLIPAQVHRVVDRSIISNFGQPASREPFVLSLLPENDGDSPRTDLPKNLNYPVRGIFLRGPRTSHLGAMIRLQLSNLSDTDACKFAICHVIAVPLAKSVDFLTAQTPIPRDIFDDVHTFPNGTNFLWVSSDAASETLPVWHKPLDLQDVHLKPSSDSEFTPETNPRRILTSSRFPSSIGMNWNLGDRPFPRFAFGGGRGNASYPWDIAGIKAKLPRGANEPHELVEMGSVVRDQVAEEQLAGLGGTPAKVHRLGSDNQGLLRFFNHDSYWSVWQLKPERVDSSLVEFLASTDSGATAFQSSVLKDLFHEDKSLDWSMIEVTNRTIPGVSYVSPSSRSIDFHLRPSPLTSTEIEKTGEFVEFSNQAYRARVSTKDEFPGIATGDFFSDFWFRVRFHAAEYSYFHEDPHQMSEFVTYLFHNTTQGNGIWLIKGQISHISDSYRKWRAGKR